ncbi:MAG: hypothetical protein ACLSVG_02870 [Clostridia bacterium]
MDFTKTKQSKRLTVFLWLCVFAYTCLPLFTDKLFDAHDISYHLNRIEGIAAALKNGQFPVRIHPNILNDYGYANSIFYPEIFLYLPGALRALGVNLSICYKILIAALNAGTVSIAYYSFKRLFKSQYAAYLGTVLYGLSLYRLLCIYVRGAVGEVLAMMFLPLAALGLYEIFYGNPQKWYYLAIAFIGILQSHIITAQLMLYTCILAALVALHKLIEKKCRRLLAAVKAAVLTIVVNLWFLIPFFDFMRAGVKITGTDFVYWGNTINPPSKLFAFLYPVTRNMTTRDNMPRSIGLSLFLLLLIFIGYWLQKRRQDVSLRERRLYFLGKSGLLFGGIALYMSTCLFPWILFKYVPLLNRIASSMQFPWRLLSIGSAAACITAVAACLLLRRDTKISGKILFIAVSVVTVFSSTVLIDNIVYNMPLFGDIHLSAPIDDPNWVYDGQYSLKSTDIDSLAKRGEIVLASNATCRLSEIVRSGGALTVSFVTEKPSAEDYVEVPISWYPHYASTIDGTDVKNEPGYNNVIRVYTQGRSTGTVRVEWKSPVLYRVVECISLLAAVGYPLNKKYGLIRRLYPKQRSKA